MADTVVVAGGSDNPPAHESVSSIEARIAHLESELGNKADREHAHPELAAADHSHPELAPIEHSHDEYVEDDELEAMVAALDEDLLQALGADHAPEPEHTDIEPPAPSPEPDKSESHKKRGFAF